MKDIHLAYIIYITCTSKTYCSFSSASQILHWKPQRFDSSNMFLRWYSLETAWFMKSEQHFSVSAFLQLLCRASNWPLQRTQRQLRSQPPCASISPVSLGLDDMDPKLKFTKQRMIPAKCTYSWTWNLDLIPTPEIGKKKYEDRIINQVDLMWNPSMSF